MIGLGTFINVCCILVGGAVGLAGKRLMVPRVQDTLMKATGLCVLFVGIAGAIEQMMVVEGDRLSSGGTAMMVVAFAVGSAIGELIDIDARFERLGEWLKQVTGSTGDADFVNAFVSASLTVSIGAMAIVGAIQDGIADDWSTLALKGALDAVIVCVMSASLGRGCLFSALPVAIIQGSITLLAQPIRPIMTEVALTNLSLVGSMLIFCVGVNLIWEHTFKPANMLPAVVIAVIWAIVA